MRHPGNARLKAAGKLGLTGIVLLAGAAIIVRYWPRSSTAFSPIRSTVPRVPTAQLTAFQRAVLDNLHLQTASHIRYQDGYFAGGNPPSDVGVCTDVVVRAFKAGHVDLQREVAADIRAHPAAYRLQKPDANIDHRRCRNLVVFFRRHARTLPVQGASSVWLPGDIVFWDTQHRGNADHIGLIANGTDADGSPTVVQHWPGMVVSETDGLHRLPVVAHFRWPAVSAQSARGRTRI